MQGLIANHFAQKTPVIATAGVTASSGQILTVESLKGLDVVLRSLKKSRQKQGANIESKDSGSKVRSRVKKCMPLQGRELHVIQPGLSLPTANWQSPRRIVSDPTWKPGWCPELFPTEI